MIARTRTALFPYTPRFRSIELLVVMIIIGILAAIAIPVFMNQRKEAMDTGGKSNVSTIGKAIATYYVNATATLPAATGITGPASGRYTLVPPTGATQELGK